MKQVAIVDQDGNFVDVDMVERLDGSIIENEDGTFTVLKEVPQPIHKLKFDFETEEFVEGLTDKEIEEIINAPKPTPVEQKLGQQLVEKDLQIMKLEKNNHDLGEQVVDHDIRIMKGGL